LDSFRTSHPKGDARLDLKTYAGRKKGGGESNALGFALPRHRRIHQIFKNLQANVQGGKKRRRREKVLSAEVECAKIKSRQNTKGRRWEFSIRSARTNVRELGGLFPGEKNGQIEKGDGRGRKETLERTLKTGEKEENSLKQKQMKREYV